MVVQVQRVDSNGRMDFGVVSSSIWRNISRKRGSALIRALIWRNSSGVRRFDEKKKSCHRGAWAWSLNTGKTSNKECVGILSASSVVRSSEMTSFFLGLYHQISTSRRVLIWGYLGYLTDRSFRFARMMDIVPLMGFQPAASALRC